MTPWQRFTLIPFLMASFVLTAPAAEDVDPFSPVAPPAKQSSSGASPTLRRFPSVLGQNLTSNLFTRANLMPFLIGSAGALAVSPADQEISNAMYRHAPELGDATDIWVPIVNGSVTGGFFMLSRFSKSGHFRAFGYTLAQSSLMNLALMEGLKLATHRMRPNGSGSDSFPSGHTSSSFAVATVVSDYYGKKWGIPLYVTAGFIGLSRIEHGSHWPSDVVAGAALGYISARTAIAGTKRELLHRKTANFMILPNFGKDWRGVTAYICY